MIKKLFQLKKLKTNQNKRIDDKVDDDKFIESKSYEKNEFERIISSNNNANYLYYKCLDLFNDNDDAILKYDKHDSVDIEQYISTISQHLTMELLTYQDNTDPLNSKLFQLQSNPYLTQLKWLKLLCTTSKRVELCHKSHLFIKVLSILLKILKYYHDHQLDPMEFFDINNISYIYENNHQDLYFDVINENNDKKDHEKDIPLALNDNNKNQHHEIEIIENIKAEHVPITNRKLQNHIKHKPLDLIQLLTEWILYFLQFKSSIHEILVSNMIFSLLNAIEIYSTSQQQLIKLFYIKILYQIILNISTHNTNLKLMKFFDYSKILHKLLDKFDTIHTMELVPLIRATDDAGFVEKNQKKNQKKFKKIKKSCKLIMIN